MQKTKVMCTISHLAVAPNTRTDGAIATASDTTRANYFDTFVKPFSKISQIEVDLQMYQQSATVNADGYIQWAFWKSVGGSPAPGSPVCTGAGLTFVPFTIRQGIAAVPMLSSTGLPSIYHLHGIIKIPKKHQLMAPGDILYFSWVSGTGAGTGWSVNGRINYMFKV